MAVDSYDLEGVSNWIKLLTIFRTFSLRIVVLQGGDIDFRS